MKRLSFLLISLIAIGFYCYSDQYVTWCGVPTYTPSDDALRNNGIDPEEYHKDLNEIFCGSAEDPDDHPELPENPGNPQ